MGVCCSCVSRISLLLLLSGVAAPLPSRSMPPFAGRQLAFSAWLRTPPRGPSVGAIVRRRGALGVRGSHSGGDEGSANGHASEGFGKGNERRFKLFYNDGYEVPLPPKHRFPMGKYRIVRELLQRDPSLDNIDFQVSPLVSGTDLRTTHCAEYISRFLCNMLTPAENRAVGFPWSPGSVKRALSSVGGTVAATHAVLQDGYWAAGHVAGGTHHAFFDRGEGFCVFSDIAVAANVALRDYAPSSGKKRGVERVLIVDLDVHQGNGNAVLFSSERRVTTFSMHCEGNFFSEIQISDVDVALPIGCSDSEYLAALDTWLPLLFTSARPDLTYFQAGIDGLESDRLGRMSLTAAGLRARNARVMEAAAAYGSPIVVTMGGGYPSDLEESSAPFQEVCAVHADVYIEAAAAVRTPIGNWSSSSRN